MNLYSFLGFAVISFNLSVTAPGGGVKASDRLSPLNLRGDESCLPGATGAKLTSYIRGAGQECCW